MMFPYRGVGRFLGDEDMKQEFSADLKIIEEGTVL